MAKFEKSEARDYKERFEFRVTVANTGNIICQRYFKINNFNENAIRSNELKDTVVACAHRIDGDLKDKTQVYLSIYAPRVFDSVEQMTEFYANPRHQSEMVPGEGIVVRGAEKDYFWGINNKPEVCSFKFDDGELTTGEPESVDYKFSFMVDGKEACSAIWTGVYPKYIRNSIDLTNKRGKFDGEDKNCLYFEQYLLYKLVEGRSDLVWGIIKDICYVCSSTDNDYYTVDSQYGDRKYENKLSLNFDKNYWPADPKASKKKFNQSKK